MTDPGPPQDPFAPPPGAWISPSPPSPVPPWAGPQFQQPAYPWQQGAWQQPPPWYGGWQTPRKTNGLAIAALVTGIIALIPVAIGLGIAALVQIRRRNDSGTGLAIGGLVAAGIWTLLIGVFVTAGLFGAFDYNREGDLADVASQEVGTCLNESPPAIADCSTPHDLEIFYTDSLTDSTWPGKGDVDSEADDLCYNEFEDYVGTSYESSDYDYTFYAPSKTEWSSGQRTVVCVITPAGRSLTGSVKGSGN
jgi:hypothetical protein